MLNHMHAAEIGWQFVIVDTIYYIAYEIDPEPTKSTTGRGQFFYCTVLAEWLPPISSTDPFRLHPVCAISSTPILSSYSISSKQVIQQYNITKMQQCSTT